MMLLLLAAAALLSLVFLLHRKTKTAGFQPPPGPKPLPIIGNLHQLDPNLFHLYVYNLAKIYGPILSLRFGSLPTVVIQSAKMAKVVLKTQDHNFCTRPALLGQQTLSYNGLDLAFAPYNSYFREMRKLSVVHLLSSNRVQSFASIRKQEVSRMIHKISSLSSASKLVNLSDLLMTLTTSIISRIAFSKRCEDEGIGRSRFHSLLNEAQAVFATLYFSDFLPWMGWLDKLTGQSSRLQRVFKELDAFYDQIINEHLHPDHRPPADNGEDIIDVLLQLRKERNFGFDITLDHVKALLMNIFVAGTDTSAAMVVWAMTELMKNPIAKRKAKEELHSMFPDKSFIEEDDLVKLKYLKAVVKETFRLHPAAPLLIARQALQGCVIEGYQILPKTLVYVSVWAIGRDPECWKDPEIFMPDRFLGDKSLVDFRGNDFGLIPFGAGRRICPGLLLGIANFELALANLLLSFDWELPAGMKEEDIDTNVIPGITMHKKNPLCLVAKKLP